MSLSILAVDLTHTNIDKLQVQRATTSMCTKVIIEHRCGHRVLRGNTRCYKDDCPGRREDITKVEDDCAQCEGKTGRWKSTRWCGVGCCVCQ